MGTRLIYEPILIGRKRLDTMYEGVFLCSHVQFDINSVEKTIC